MSLMWWPTSSCTRLGTRSPGRSPRRSGTWVPAGGGVVFSVGVHYWGRVHYPKAYNPAYASSELCKFFHRGSNVIRVRMTISGCFEELGWFMWNLLPWITSHSGRHKILFLPNHPFFRQRHHRNPFEQSSSTSLQIFLRRIVASGTIARVVVTFHNQFWGHHHHHYNHIFFSNQTQNSMLPQLIYKSITE